MFDDPDVIVDLFQLGIGALVFGGVAAKGWLVAQRANAPISDNECIACGSHEVDEIAPAVYQCMMCEYVGGSGYADYAARKQVEKLDAMPIEQRRKLARKDLVEARTMMLALEGEIALALDLAKRDANILNRGKGEDDAKTRAVFKVFSDVLQINKLIEDAADKAEDPSLLDICIHGNFDPILNEHGRHAYGTSMVFATDWGQARRALGALREIDQVAKYSAQSLARALTRIR